MLNLNSSESTNIMCHSLKFLIVERTHCLVKSASGSTMTLEQVKLEEVYDLSVAQFVEVRAGQEGGIYALDDILLLWFKSLGEANIYSQSTINYFLKVFND
jgi:hypothetical protein